MRGEEAPIAIDVGSRGVKVAQVITRGERLVEVRCGYGQLPPGFVWAPEKQDRPVEEALARALEQAEAKGRRAVCILPRHQVTLRFTEFPLARSEEMAKMASLEAEQHIPLPSAEMVVGYEALGAPRPESALVPVLIAAARRAVVQGYLSLLSAADLEPQQITFDGLCLFKMWQSQAIDPEPAFLLDLGARGMVINLIEGGLLRMSRTVPGGGEDLSRAFQSDFGLSLNEAEEMKQARGLTVLAERKAGAVAGWAEVLAAEIRRSAMAFATQSTRPTRVYLSGGGSLLPGLDRSLEEATGLRVSSLFPPQNLLPPQQGAVFALPYAASLAASRARKGEALNLLLPEAVAEGKTLHRRRAWLAAGLAVGVALLTFIGGSYATLRHREGILSRTTPKWESARRDLEQAGVLSEERNRLLSQADFLVTAHKGKHYFLDLLLEIHERAPKGIWLTSLMMEKAPAQAGKNARILQIAGKAPDNKVVASLVSALSEIPGLKAVNLQSAKAAQFGDKRVVEFSLSCELGEEAEPASAREAAKKEEKAE